MIRPGASAEIDEAADGACFAQNGRYQSLTKPVLQRHHITIRRQMRRDGVAGGFRILRLHTKQHAAELALQRGRRIGGRDDPVRINRAFNGEAHRRVADCRHMIFDDIHKHHGMTRSH
jgi:hypothetical protein